MNNETNTSVLKKWTQKLALPARVALLAGALAVGASGLAWMHPSQAKEQTATLTPVRLSVNDQPLSHEGRGTTSFAPVDKEVAPSGVKVFVTTKGKNSPIREF